ncbi:hypothetical protein [Hydrogenimonas sp. SS33]|uniref:hypothetical protein n=1 Tax=Hydrogenimonas leucolamina TaxID=2954236 RepID=UPI00336BC6CE
MPAPKPVCSQHGVLFDHSREDRYPYLDILVQLIEAFDRRTVEGETLHFGIKSKPFPSEVTLKKLRRYIPDLERKIGQSVESTEEELEKEMASIRSNPILSETEKEVWIGNLQSMRPYIVQRAINKRVYHEAVEVLADTLVDHHIRYVALPMVGTFHHAVKSLEAALERHKPPARLHSRIHETDSGPVLELEVI